MTGFAALLELQDHDTATDQLRHRRGRLAQRAALVEGQRALSALAARRADLAVRREETSARETDLDTQLGTITRRVSDIERRMYSGEVAATRDLLAMSAEIESLKARAATVEQDAMVVMEEAEVLDGEVAEVEAQAAVRDAEQLRLRNELAEAEGGVDAELGEVAVQRAAAAATVPAEVLALYERLRTELGGVGAARLVGVSCTGCHLTLPSSEVARIRREPPGALVLCDQCGRILVR
ncbi:MAG: zinc ribbon domain-containing protein [Acidimicrobiales bacterium]